VYGANRLDMQGRRKEVESARKNCGVAPLFGTTSTISRFGECFRDVQYS